MKTKIILLFFIFNIFGKCQAKCVCFPTPSCETVISVQNNLKTYSYLDIFNFKQSDVVKVSYLLQYTEVTVIGDVVNANTKDNLTYLCDYKSIPSHNDLKDKTPFTLIFLEKRIESFVRNILNTYKDVEILGLMSYQPEWFKLLNSIRELYINSANIESIEEEVFQDLIYLEVLDLSDNQIQTIHSDSFANLPSLVTLNLNGNNITSIDQNLFEILPIKNLMMSDNLCASGGIEDASKADITNVLIDCYKLYRPRLLINEDQNYQWMSEINALKNFVQASNEEILSLIVWDTDNPSDLEVTTVS